MSDSEPSNASARRRKTETSAFGAGRREGHDASAFYARFRPPVLSDDETVNHAEALALHPSSVSIHGSSVETGLPDNSVALVVTSPPYFVGKEYELAVGDGSDTVPETYLEFLNLLREVFAECERVLEPGGRIAVNVANLGRKPYRSLSADITASLQDDLGLLLRGEVIWQKGKSSSGSCAWGSFAKATNPVLRDITERVIIASKGRFSRAVSLKDRASQGLPHVSSLTNDEFVDVTRDVWEIDTESATRVGHPAPFPIELPRRLIELYTYEGDIVLDPLSGSGTTMVAAEQTGRVGLGFDTDVDYVELANKRIANEGAISPDNKHEARHGTALVAGRKMLDLATDELERLGFVFTSAGAKFGPLGIELTGVATAKDGTEYFVDVVGGFTLTKPGLQRSEEVWRSLARYHVLKTAHPDARLLVITSSLPRAGTPPAKALVAATDPGSFEVFELFDDASATRLAELAG